MNQQHLVPAYVEKLCRREDVHGLLLFWEREVWPLPVDNILEHPLFPAIEMVALTLDKIGENMLTPAQRVAPRYKDSWLMPAENALA